MLLSRRWQCLLCMVLGAYLEFSKYLPTIFFSVLVTSDYYYNDLTELSIKIWREPDLFFVIFLPVGKDAGSLTTNLSLRYLIIISKVYPTLFNKTNQNISNCFGNFSSLTCHLLTMMAPPFLQRDFCPQ